MTPTIDQLPRLWGHPLRPSSAHDYWYVRTKLALDPVYRATFTALDGTRLPLLDLGCGFGLLVASLRACGWSGPTHGLDYDRRKIATARDLAARHPDFFGPCRFDHTDLREGLPAHAGHITILDILQFFTPEQRRKLLTQAAERIAPDGCLIIRQTLDHPGGSRLASRAVDRLAGASRWMRDHPTGYPGAEEIMTTLADAGLEGGFDHLPGKLPLDNWFAVFRRAER